MGRRITDVEREAIRCLLRDGQSQCAVAKRMGCSPSTVNRLSKEVGLVYSPPKPANAARRTFAKQRRLELSDVLFVKLHHMVAECETPREFRDLAVVFGILIDKRLLEEGSPTQRIEEKVTGNGAREKLARLLASVEEPNRASGDS